MPASGALGLRAATFKHLHHCQSHSYSYSYSYFYCDFPGNDACRMEVENARVGTRPAIGFSWRQHTVRAARCTTSGVR